MSKKRFCARGVLPDGLAREPGPGAVQNPTSDRHHGWSGRQLPERQRGTPGATADRSPRAQADRARATSSTTRGGSSSSTALYQLPGNFGGRDERLRPSGLRVSGLHAPRRGGDGIPRTLAVQNIDDKRYDNLWDADFRPARNSVLEPVLDAAHGRSVQRVQLGNDPRPQPPGQRRRCSGRRPTSWRPESCASGHPAEFLEL